MDAALTQWCEGQPDMVAFADACQVHRAEIMQQLGTWDEAIIRKHAEMAGIGFDRPLRRGRADVSFALGLADLPGGSKRLVRYCASPLTCDIYRTSAFSAPVS